MRCVRCRCPLIDESGCIFCSREREYDYLDDLYNND